MCARCGEEVDIDSPVIDPDSIVGYGGVGHIKMSILWDRFQSVLRAEEKETVVIYSASSIRSDWRQPSKHHSILSCLTGHPVIADFPISTCYDDVYNQPLSQSARGQSYTCSDPTTKPFVVMFDSSAD